MHRWFHPNLTNVQAERKLLEQGVDGSFLVRPSKSCPGHFSLSIRKDDQVTHIKIRHLVDFYDLNGGEQFATLAELIQHYTENQLKDKNGQIYELKWPMRSSDPTTERWFHGPISGAVAESLILERGVAGSFLVRESHSKIGDYVLTVRTKDELQQARITHLIIRHHNDQYDIGGGEKFDSLTELVEHYRKNTMVETTGTVVHLKYPFNATCITASDIDARVSELSKENQQNCGKEGFWEEFEHLQHQEFKVLFNRKIGQEDKNMLKNRYKNILPYDYTRVILKKPPSFKSEGDNISSDSDYINANYIKLVEDGATISPTTWPVTHSKVYIATQGPLPNTLVDFWWMVWQEKSDTIVMVTREVERCKNKCYRYWPTLEQKLLSCGPFEIEITQSVTDNEDYISREFELRYLVCSERREFSARRVVQYQYHSWPDQNTPANPTSVVDFLQSINRRPPKGPMIVHCSAGIGRSGTLIVIDMLMDQLKYHGLTYEIDIQRIVKIARAQRSGLVQTEAQYKFIYLAIQNYVSRVKRMR